MRLLGMILRLHLIIIMILLGCNPIGCDGIAGSQRRLDRCGICGGDNSTCRVVSGIFTRPQLAVGYNIVAHIPRGACNLNITQIRKSPNYLALRQNNGEYIVNGDFRLSRPGEYEGAGAKFHYTRQDLKSLESIASPGPLHEPVDLLVLYQQPNPGIKYEYMLPLSDATIPPLPIPEPIPSLNHRQHSAATSRPASFISNPPANLLSGTGNTPNPINTIPSFPKSSAASVGTPTGSGIPYPGDSSSTYNIPKNQFQSGHPHLHSHHGRRRNHNNNKLVATLNSDKKFYWKITAYSNCSEPCGGGMQRAIVRCVRGANGTPATDRRCQGEEKPLSQTIRCNLKPCPAEWTIGPWSSCSDICGEGSQTRTVNCQQRVSPTLTMRVAEGACLEATPESKKVCFIKPCHRWEATDWSQCSARCGNGIRSRIVTCLDANNAKIDHNDCDPVNKPVEISPCNMGPCEGVDWFVSDWSIECSQKCGSGLQTRHVICSGLFPNMSERIKSNSKSAAYEIKISPAENEHLLNLEGSTKTVASSENFYCDDSKKPADERECFTDRNCGEAVWFSGPWSECSVTCGNGLKTRQVLCVLFNRGKFKVVDESLCTVATRPLDKAVCESKGNCPPRWFTTEWAECSSLCGGGIQKRSVSCRADNWTLSSSNCLDTDRPIERRSCNEQKCSLVNRLSDINTDLSGMVKDNPPLSFQTEPPRSTNSSPSTISYSSSRNQDEARTHIQSQSYGHSQEPNEELEDGECTDQYRNCPLVVQARLCRYKYYRSVCCSACSDN